MDAGQWDVTSTQKGCLSSCLFQPLWRSSVAFQVHLFHSWVPRTLWLSAFIPGLLSPAVGVNGFTGDICTGAFSGFSLGQQVILIPPHFSQSSGKMSSRLSNIVSLIVWILLVRDPSEWRRCVSSPTVCMMHGGCVGMQDFKREPLKWAVHLGEVWCDFPFSSFKFDRRPWTRLCISLYISAVCAVSFSPFCSVLLISEFVFRLNVWVEGFLSSFFPIHFWIVFFCTIISLSLFSLCVLGLLIYFIFLCLSFCFCLPLFLFSPPLPSLLTYLPTVLLYNCILSFMFFQISFCAHCVGSLSFLSSLFIY